MRYIKYVTNTKRGIDSMCLLSTQEEQFKDLYAELKKEWVTAKQTNFTPLDML